jgi:hypothetical protein
MEGKNLQNADLHNANLQNADLQNANLRGANLSGANLRGANLLSAHLGGANLTGAILATAGMQHADAENANFENANLRQANLQGADLQNSVFTGADLYGANLTRANLFGASLQTASLQAANLHGANLHGATLTNANLQRADLTFSNLIGANLTGANLQDANLRGAQRGSAGAVAAVSPSPAKTPFERYTPGPPPPPPTGVPTSAPGPVYIPAGTGEVPILFNNHYVNTDDVMRHNRVLAALVRGQTILVPLEAMLKQMGGAQVTYDQTSQIVDVRKPGAHVVFTIGVARVTVNGRVHPLDVAPTTYEGDIMVPLRVLSEGLGAYVQWLQERHLVVVRYGELTAMLPPPTPVPTPMPRSTPTAPPRPTPPPPPRPTPVPTRARTATPLPVPTPFVTPTLKPTPAPSPLPTSSPSPAPRVIAAKKHHNNHIFFSGDYLNAPAVSNELAPAKTVGNQSFALQAAFEFGVPTNMYLIQVDFKQYRFPHNAFQQSIACSPAPTGCSTVNGNGTFNSGLCPGPDPGCVTAVAANILGAQTGRAQEYVPAFNAIDTDVDLRVALKILSHTYLGMGAYYKHYSYLGYPAIRGVGFGVSKTPNLDKQLSFFGSMWYYPAVNGKYSYPTSPFLGPFSGATVPFGYSVLKYRAGMTFLLPATSLFVEAGWAGEIFNSTINTPGNAWQEGSFFGIGTRFPR